MDDKTVVVGSPEHRALQREKLHARFDQALEVIADSGSAFSAEQRAALHNAIVLLRWGVEEAL